VNIPLRWRLSAHSCFSCMVFTTGCLPALHRRSALSQHTFLRTRCWFLHLYLPCRPLNLLPGVWLGFDVDSNGSLFLAPALLFSPYPCPTALLSSCRLAAFLPDGRAWLPLPGQTARTPPWCCRTPAIFVWAFGLCPAYSGILLAEPSGTAHRGLLAVRV